MIVPNNTYDFTARIRWEVGFVTPFDPRIEVRTSNFFHFKTEMLRLGESGQIEEAEARILASKDIYVAPRTLRTIAELAALHNFTQIGNMEQLEIINNI